MLPRWLIVLLPTRNQGCKGMPRSFKFLLKRLAACVLLLSCMTDLFGLETTKLSHFFKKRDQGKISFVRLEGVVRWADSESSQLVLEDSSAAMLVELAM